ncbi:Halomucin [Bienertia sinuspersici]
MSFSFSTHTFFSDPKVFEMMDEIVNIVLSVKNMPGGLNEICIFLDGSSGAKNAEGDMGFNSGVMENARTNQSGDDDNNVQTNVGDNNNGDENESGNNDNNIETNDADNNNGDGNGSGDDGDNNNNDGNEFGDDDSCDDKTVFGCALTKNCSIDIEEMNLDENVVFVSYFMRNHSKDMKGLRPLHQELCDYYFVNDSEMDSREFMVWLHPNFINHGDDMVSVKFLELAFKEDNASQVDELLNCWHEWLTVNNHGFNLDTLELIFIPIFLSNHYFLFVVNIPQKKIQFIDSLSYDKQEKCALCQLCECLADQVSMFFDGMGLVNAPYIIDYPMEFVTLNWKSSKQNVDCGLYVMMSMLLFHGSDEFSCDNLKKAPMRRVLRAKICTALVLSERNDVRSEILDKMKAMRPSRPQLQKKVEQRRKQELEDLKKNEYAAKREAKKN